MLDCTAAKAAELTGVGPRRSGTLPTEVRSRIEPMQHAATGVQGTGRRAFGSGWVPAKLTTETVAVALETPCGRLWKSVAARCLEAGCRHSDD